MAGSATDADAWDDVVRFETPQIKPSETEMEQAHKPIAAGLFLLICLVQFPSIACADGGVVRLSEVVGEYKISLFTSPNPLRVGQVDVSVLVQNVDSTSAIPDARVTIKLSPHDRPDGSITQEASGAASTNKLLQAAIFELPEPGWWDLAVVIDGPNGHAETHCQFEVSESWPSWLNLAPWVAWPAVPILLFAVHLALVRRRARELRLGAKPL